MELLVDASAELSWLSEASRIPDTELALVVADDSAEVCCRDVLVVVSDSRLFRFSPFSPGSSLMLSWSNSVLKALAAWGESGVPEPLAAECRPNASGAKFCRWLCSGWYPGVCGGGVGASGVFGSARSKAGRGMGPPCGRCVSMFPVEGRAQSCGWKLTLTGEIGDCRSLGDSDIGATVSGFTFSPQSYRSTGERL
jgi:hypothetical protein